MNLRLRLGLTVLLLSVPLVAGSAWLRADLERQSVEGALAEFALVRMEAGERERCEADPSRYPIDARILLQQRRSENHEPGSRPGRSEGPRRGPEGLERGRPGERLSERPGSFRPGRPQNRGQRNGMPRLSPEQKAEFEERPRPEFGAFGGRRPVIELFAYDADFRSPNAGVPEFPAALRTKLAGGEQLASIENPEREHFLFDLGLRTEWSDGPCAILLVRRRSGSPAWQPGEHLRSALFVSLLVTFVVLLAAGPLVVRVRRLTAEVRESAAEHYALPTSDQSRDELGELARAFNEAGLTVRGHLLDLEEREARLRRFVENTTHDVAIPLTVLQGHLSELSSSQVPAPADGDSEHLTGSIQEAHYIAAILANLGVAAKLEAVEERIDTSPVDISSLVERVHLRHQMIARESGVSVEYSVPENTVIVAGDVTLLEQALGNVVHNAVRFNSDGGHVAVVLSATGEDFSLRVVDDGPGIPEGEVERLVERSFRGDEARARQPDGRGLGLHIVKEVLQRHGFELKLESSEYGGLAVTFAGKLLDEDGLD